VILPTIDAVLNAAAALCLSAGYYFIKKKNIKAHKACMISALGVSAVFLTCYLVYHYNVGSVRFAHEGWIRAVYFPLLLSHTVLAAVIVPMVLRTAYLGVANQLARHTGLAKWTFPMWMYVSITGVMVYLMLYQL